MGSAWFGSAGLGSARGRLGRLGWARPGLAGLAWGWGRMGSAVVGSAWLGLARQRSAGLGWARVGSGWAGLGWHVGVVVGLAQPLAQATYFHGDTRTDGSPHPPLLGGERLETPPLCRGK